MVDYFVAHPHVATGKFKTMHGKADLDGSWEQLVNQLNEMGKGTKDVKSCKSTWRDNKTAVSHKVAKMRRQKGTTGNIGSPPVPLTERDKKILDIMGYDYVEGTQCPDAFPEELPNAIYLLAEGEEGILNNDADILTVRENSVMSSLGYTDYETLEPEECLTEPTNSQALIVVSEQIEPNKAVAGTSKSISGSGLSIRKSTSQMSTASRVSKQNRKRLATQLQEARKDFESLAERQISCMEMFARAMQKIADNDQERNEILRAFVAAEKAKEDAFKESAVMIKDCVEILKRQ